MDDERLARPVQRPKLVSFVRRFGEDELDNPTVQEAKYAEMLRRIGPGPTVHIPFPGRTFVRTQGCWNCVSWENGEMAQKRFAELRLRDVRLCLEAGMTLEQAETALDRGLAMLQKTTHRLLRPPGVGICLRGKSRTEMCDPTFLCDFWTGRVNAHPTTPYAKPDPLPQELRDKLGEHVRGDGE